MSRKIKRILFAWVALALFATALPAFAQEPVGSINTGAANLRSGPGVQFGAISALPYGFGVTLVARNTNGQWVFVRLNNGVTGWVGSGLIYTTADVLALPVNDGAAASAITPTATVSTGAVNVRASADPNSAVITTLGQGQGVTLLGRNYNGTWAFVRLSDGRTGWITASGLVATVPIRSLAPADGSIAAPIAPAPTTGGTAQTAYRTYVVVRGDTLGSIARAYGVNLYTLAQLNGIYNINYVQAGQTLYIPS